MIELKNIRKTFRVPKRESGFAQAARSLFHREYTEIHALDGVSFTVPDGQTVGYIGPNGAGKSSTVKIMSGILTPDSGECRIDGLCPWQDRKKHTKNIGVVFGQRSQLWWDVPVADSFALLRDIYGIEQGRFRKTADELTERLELQDILKTPARMLSLGQRMRCEIAASLLHEPKLLFLDEPTIGLDAVSKIAVRSFLKTLREEKKTTIILTTHDMADIEALAERILLIGKGRILLDGSFQELKRRHGSKKQLSVSVSGGTVPQKKGLLLLEKQPGLWKFEVDTDVLPVSSAIQTLSDCAAIQDLSVSDTSMETLVVSLYQEFCI